MINYLLTYDIVMSLYLLWWYHGKVVVPGHEDGILKRVGKWHVSVVVRGWILAFVLFYGWINQGLGHGYGTWWYDYFSDHSLILWCFTTIPVTVVLWVIWFSTMSAAKKPGSIGWWEPGTAPSLHKISTALPAMWCGAFYLWLLLTPTLPFYSCYVRMFVSRTSYEVVFR